VSDLTVEQLCNELANERELNTVEAQLVQRLADVISKQFRIHAMVPEKLQSRLIEQMLSSLLDRFVKPPYREYLPMVLQMALNFLEKKSIAVPPSA